MTTHTPDFWRGTEYPHIVFIGACPGKEEEKEGRPFVGEAGRFLRAMTRFLHERNMCILSSPELDAYTLLNAHHLPRYRERAGFDGDTEPTRDDILDSANQSRIRRRLREVKARVVIYVGNQAFHVHEVARVILEHASFFRLGHPSKPAWNTRYQGSEQERLARWVEDTFERCNV